MKISLNSARLGMNDYSFTQFVDLAARHGFDGVDFGISGAMRQAQEIGGGNSALESAPSLRDFLAEKDVAPAVFGLEVEWRRDDEAFQQGLANLATQAAFAEAIGCSRCVTWMPPSVNDDPAAWTQRTIARFREIARVLGSHGVRLGLEWVGPHHLRAGAENAMGANPVVYTLDGTLDLIAQIGAPNVGLLVDCYHCFTTGIGEAQVAKLTDAQIVHVHVNDAPRGTTSETAKDGERVLPGEGVIDLAGFLRGLRAAGYQGYIAAEVLAPQNIAGTPDDAAAKVRAALQHLGL